MVNELEERLDGDHSGAEVETEEQLATAYKQLKDLVGKGQDGSLVSYGKQELSLMQKILSTGSEKYRNEQWWRECDFEDQEEAMKHVNAFFEAEELGMDTHFNVAYSFSLSSTNRKIVRNNLIAQLLSSLEHGKWASAQQGRKKDGTNPRSPLSN